MTARAPPPAPLDDAVADRLRALAALESERLPVAALRGEVVGDRFRLEEPIGEGGMGVVWRAVDVDAGEAFAVKVVAAADDAARARFAREASALAALDDPRVVRYVAHGTLDTGECWLATELLEGCVLGELLAERRLSIADAVAVARRAAEALAVVHDAGMVHRDVKPSNLFLVGGNLEEVVLLDLGLVRDAASVTVTRTGTVLGTAAYVAPEQIRSSREVDARADVFALGLVLFECVAGRPPFVAERTEEALLKTLMEEPPALRELAPEIDAALEGLVARMLEKDPARRPADGGEVAEALRALEAHVATAPAAGPGGAEGPLRKGAVVADKYEIEGRIGEGGMGVVLAARQRPLGRRVAIKVLRARGKEAEARFLREAQSASQLESEHATRVLDYGTLEDGAPYMVMEWLDGLDLGRWIARSGAAGAADAASWLVQACEAVAEAHARGVVHRDLKPSNLFLARRVDGSKIVKVLDFGISKIFAVGSEGDEAGTTLTAPADVVGSPRYMSPEQLKSARDVDARTDVWSLGAVLHELLSGRPAFDATTPVALAAQIASEPPAPLDPKVPTALRRLVARCLTKDREARLASVVELAQALATWGTDQTRDQVGRIERIARRAQAPHVEARPPADDGGASVESYRHLRLPVLIALAVGASALVAVFAGSGRRGPDEVQPTGVSVIPVQPSTPEALAPPAASTAPVRADDGPPREEASAAPRASATGSARASPAAPSARAASRPSSSPTGAPSSKAADRGGASPSASAAQGAPRPAPSAADPLDPALEGR